MTKRTFLTTILGSAGVLVAASQLRFRKEIGRAHV